MLSLSKLISISSKISAGLINNEISHIDFITIINEVRKYPELTESIRVMKSQKRDTQKVNLIEEGQKIRINEVIKKKKFINKGLRLQIQNNVILLFKV